MYYALNDRFDLVPLGDDVRRWTEWHEDHQRMVWIGREEWEDDHGLRVVVSTRFFGTTGYLWETIVLIDGHLVEEARLGDYYSALASHGTTLLQCLSAYPREIAL
jgi:hypothetical protein